MVGLLMQPTTFSSSPSTKSNVCSKQSTKRAVKMKCSLQSPPIRGMKFFSPEVSKTVGPALFLRFTGVNALDNMVNRSQDFHSKVATATSVGRGEASRIVTKATFERINSKHFKVIILAEEEARELGQNSKCTAMILLGLIGEDTGIAAKVLKSMGINYENVYAEVVKIIGKGRGFVGEKIPYTPLASRVFRLSIEVARQLGRNYFGTQHLLLALLSVGDCVAVRVLENLGADPDDIRTQVMKMVAESAKVVGGGVGGRSSVNERLIQEEYGTNFTKLSEEDKSDAVVERQPPIESVAQDPVGLTKTGPETIEGKKVITLDMGLVQELEGRLKKLIKLSDEINLFIHEFHTLIGVREGDGDIDAA